MPIFVACSMFGALNSAIFAPSRLPLAGARNGHLPKALAFLNVDTYTPIPALTFLVIKERCHSIRILSNNISALSERNDFSVGTPVHYDACS